MRVEVLRAKAKGAGSHVANDLFATGNSRFNAIGPVGISYGIEAIEHVDDQNADFAAFIAYHTSPGGQIPQRIDVRCHGYLRASNVPR